MQGQFPTLTNFKNVSFQKKISPGSEGDDTP